MTSLPDYKTTFPNWPRQKLLTSMKGVDPEGIDLLEVSMYVWLYLPQPWPQYSVMRWLHFILIGVHRNAGGGLLKETAWDIWIDIFRG